MRTQQKNKKMERGWGGGGGEDDKSRTSPLLFHLPQVTSELFIRERRNKEACKFLFIPSAF
jgi:hypothetical protein